MKKQILAAALLAVASFGASAADPLSYTYVQAGYNRVNVDVTENVDMDFDGFAAQGSFEFAENFHVFGGYASSSNDDFIDMDLNEYSVGVGFHHEIADSADALVEVSYINREVEASLFGVSASEDVDAYRASAGLRGAFNDHVVGTLKVNYTDSDLGSEFTPSFGLEVRFNPMWSLVGDAEVGSDEHRYGIAVRASF